MSQRIGFVDFDIDNFHADVYLKLLRGDLQSRGFTVADATALQPIQAKLGALRTLHHNRTHKQWQR